MAIIEYKEGDHPQGFIGLRVVTTLGVESNYRQCYFSFREYSEMAWHRAHAINHHWRKIAEAVAQERLLEKTSAGIGWVATGFRASIRYEIKHRKSGTRRYFSPGFVVDGNQARGWTNRFIPINHGDGLTLQEAFDDALYCYALRRELSHQARADIEQRILPPEIFVLLAQSYVNRGCDLGLIRKKVGLPENSMEILTVPQ